MVHAPRPPSAFVGTSPVLAAPCDALRRALCQCACDKVFLTQNAFNVKCEKGESRPSSQKMRAEQPNKKLIDCRIPCKVVRSIHDFLQCTNLKLNINNIVLEFAFSYTQEGS